MEKKGHEKVFQRLKNLRVFHVHEEPFGGSILNLCPMKNPDGFFRSPKTFISKRWEGSSAHYTAFGSGPTAGKMTRSHSKKKGIWQKDFRHLKLFSVTNPCVPVKLL
jgi:hypothetical protein